MYLKNMLSLLPKFQQRRFVFVLPPRDKTNKELTPINPERLPRLVPHGVAVPPLTLGLSGCERGQPANNDCQVNINELATERNSSRFPLKIKPTINVRMADNLTNNISNW